MLSPLVIPFPLAVALVVLLAAVLYVIDHVLRADVWNPWAGQSWSAPAARTGGRHRPESIPEADRRDWAYVVAMRMHEAARRQTRDVVLDLEQIEIAGHDDRALDTHPAPCGFPDVMPCICAAIAEDTRELATVA
jgi:hypothetical protein